jgi:hypothetical protein
MVFEFEPDRRASYVYSDTSKILIDRTDYKVALVEDNDGLYPTDADISFRSAIYNPNKVKAWRAIMPVVSHTTILDEQKTGAGFKLFDGTNDLYWDGGAWAVAGASDWSTMEELQANFSSYTSATNELAVVTNLVASSDGVYTPKLAKIVVALDVDIKSYIDEYVYKGLMGKLREYMKPAMDWSVIWPGGTTYDMSGYKAENGIIIEDIVEASTTKTFDDDIFTSYNTTTKVLELTTPVAAGDRVFIRIVPHIDYAVSTHTDWYQPAMIPAVVFRHYRKLFAGESPVREHTVNYTTLAALAAKSPRRQDVDIPLDLLADRSLLVAQMAEMVQELVRREPILVTPGAGFEARLEVEENEQYYPRPDEEGVLRGVVRITLMNCQEWYHDATEETAVGSLHIDWSAS